MILKKGLKEFNLMQHYNTKIFFKGLGARTLKNQPVK